MQLDGKKTEKMLTGRDTQNSGLLEPNIVCLSPYDP